MSKYTAVNIISGVKISMIIESFLIIYHICFYNIQNNQMEKSRLQWFTYLNLIENLVVDNKGLINLDVKSKKKLVIVLF